MHEPNKRPNRLIPLLLVVLIAVAAGWYFKTSQVEKQALSLLEGDDKLVEIYQKALTREQQAKQESDNFSFHNAAFFHWKSLGDSTNEEYFYRRALKISNEALKNEKARSALFYLNAGNVHKILGEFDQADKNYHEAVELNEGDELMWLARIELWQYWDKKDPADVLELYDRGLNVLLSAPNLAISRGSYLASIGDYQQALSVYEAARVAFPDQKGIAEKIQELKYKIETQ
ncbi:MAG: hypothetical protein CMI52_02330 [Parcubacteria group bacterium]|nr:hypothetical protein [Parcubacteria group bacterium]